MIKVQNKQKYFIIVTTVFHKYTFKHCKHYSYEQIRLLIVFSTCTVLIMFEALYKSLSVLVTSQIGCEVPELKLCDHR